MLQRRLRREERAADVDVDDAVQFLQRRVPEFFRNGGAGVVHKYVEAAKGGDGFFDRGLDGGGVGGVRLDRDCLAAGAFDGA